MEEKGWLIEIAALSPLCPNSHIVAFAHRWRRLKSDPQDDPMENNPGLQYFVAEIGMALVERHKGNRRVPPIQNALVNIAKDSLRKKNSLLRSDFAAVRLLAGLLEFITGTGSFFDSRLHHAPVFAFRRPIPPFIRSFTNRQLHHFHPGLDY